MNIPVFNFSLQNKDKEVDIFIDGDIVDADTQSFFQQYFGEDTSVSYKSFRTTLDKADADVYNIYINSDGGQLSEAMAMHDLIIDMRAKGKIVNTIGRGRVASSATFVLLAGEKPKMTANSSMLIHNVSGGVAGNVNEVEQYAKKMRKFNDAASQYYVEYTGLSNTVISNMMDNETWMLADEAKQKGFINEVTPKTNFTNSIKPEKWIFNNKAILNTYNENVKAPTMELNKITEAITNGFNTVLDKLGLKNKSEDETVKTAFKEFSDSITNSITDSLKDSPDKDAIEKMVNEAVTNSLKTLPANFTEAIANATKDVVSKAQLEEATKNLLSNADFKKDMGELKDSIINKIGGKSSGEEEEDKKITNNKRKVHNRFSGYTSDYFAAKN